MRPFRLFRKRQRAYQQAQLDRYKLQQQDKRARPKGYLEEDDTYLFI